MTVFLVAVALLAASSASAASPEPDHLARLTYENALLRKQLDLAKGKSFYLLLDPPAGTLELRYRGALLQKYAVSGLEVGVPRVAYRARAQAEDWEGRIWEGGSLEPPRALDRVEIQAPPPTPEGNEVEIAIPPTPEEKYPVPVRYHIRFDGGLSIEVRPPGSEAERGFWGRLWDRMRAWWSDARAASATPPTDTVRLHLVMSKKDADSLYRALPPRTKLLVLPPTSP